MTELPAAKSTLIRAPGQRQSWRQGTAQRPTRCRARQLRMEYLEDRSLLSVATGTAAGLADQTALVAEAQPAAAAAKTTAFEAVFTTTVTIPESTTAKWVGYDIDARALPANAVINKIILHHTVNHPRVSDLQVKLTNDSGTEWLIRKNSGGWVKNFDEYRTDTKVFVGQKAAQLFHYQIADTVVNKLSGSLRGLQFWIIYTIPATSPDLTVTAEHTGTFAQGQDGAVYSLNVKNIGTAATSGVVSLKDILPAGVTATALSGTGWTTNLATMTATRSDALAPGANYSPLTVTVNIAPTATLSVTNMAQVSGGGETNTANNSATDPTTITAMPDLVVTSSHTGSFLKGQAGTYTITVANIGGAATTGSVSVTDVLPPGLTATGLSGDGWTVDLATLTATRTDALAAGASFAPLTLTVSVADDTPGSVINTAQVSGGGQLYTADDTATDPTTIVGDAPTLLDGSFSVSSARDGQTITVNYQISSDVAASLLLGCSIVAPDGTVIGDPANAKQVNVTPGTNWYTRTFTVNLPPNAPVGSYNATWTVHSDTSGDTSLTHANAITINQTIAVRIPVLMYHNVETTARDFYTTSTANFTAQMRALKAYGYTTVTLQDVMDYRAGTKTPPAKPILLTFDDAYESLLTVVLPIISDPSLDFHVTGFINTGNVRPEDVEGGYPTDPLSWSEIRALDASGRVDIQSHTVNHDNLTTLDATTLAAELVNSKTQLEQQLNQNKQPDDPLKQVNFLAYPYGIYNNTVAEAVWKAGYFAAMAVEDQIETTAADKYSLDRVQIDWKTSVQLDKSGWYEFFGNRIEEPSLAVPSISVTGFQYSSTSVRPGQAVTIRVNINNSGTTAPVLASLKIDADSNHSNGVIYDSHSTSPSQDIQKTAPWGASSFEWTWTVPSDAPLGQYYATVQFNDLKYVFIFRNSGWVSAFQVSSVALAAAISMQASTTTATSIASSTAPSTNATATAAAYDAVLARSAVQPSTSVATSTVRPSAQLIQTLARNAQARTASTTDASKADLVAAYDAVLSSPLSLNLGRIG